MADILRLATADDAAALDLLISRSARILQANDYARELLDVAIGTAFAQDRQLIDDRSYYLIERAGTPVACGGWSRRAKAYGGDAHAADLNALIRPGIDPARIRAFFVDPDCARQGLGSRILEASEQAALAAGFVDGVVIATLTGAPFYARHAWREVARVDEALRGGIRLPVIRMTKRLDGRTGEN